MTRTLALLTALGALLLAATVAHATSRPVFVDVDNQKQVTPHTLFLTGDGTLGVVKVSWSRWGGGPAVGTGTAEFHGCTPSCAAGKEHTAKVIVRLSDLVSCTGRRYYDRVSLRNRRTGRPMFTSYLAHQNWAPCRLG